jgi:phosphate/sulfate permease
MTGTRQRHGDVHRHRRPTPQIAVALSGVLNLVGAFLSFSVAATIASGLVETSKVSLIVVFGGLAGGIAWNLATWYLRIPSSSSQIGGVIGATFAAAGSGAVQWQNLVAKVIIPAVFSPVVAGCIAALVGLRLGGGGHVPGAGLRPRLILWYRLLERQRVRSGLDIPSL